MQGYYAIVEKESDSAFGVRFPDVEGCFSAADEEADVFKNAVEALGLHLEDTDNLPLARPLGVVTADPATQGALQNGGYLLYVPLLSNRHRPVRVNLSLDKRTLDAIDAAAKLRGLTRSAFIAEAARNEITGR